jgi:hypothetical protein
MIFDEEYIVKMVFFLTLFDIYISRLSQQTERTYLTPAKRSLCARIQIQIHSALIETTHYK